VNVGHDHPEAQVHMRHITDPGNFDSLDAMHFNMASGQFYRLFDPSRRRGPGGRRGRGGALRVTAVDVYESPLAQTRYASTRAAFGEAGKPDDEVWVFHGTSESAIEPIMKNGFEVGGSGKGVAVRNAQCHGAGVYCAEGPNTPISYSKRGQQVILARGLLGVVAEDVAGEAGEAGEGTGVGLGLGLRRKGPKYAEGQAVEGLFHADRGGKRYYPGTITHVNTRLDDLHATHPHAATFSLLNPVRRSSYSYTIRFADGDVENRVDEGCIRDPEARDSWRPVVGEDWIVFKDGAQLLPSYVVHFEEDHRYKISSESYGVGGVGKKPPGGNSFPMASAGGLPSGSRCPRSGQLRASSHATAGVLASRPPARKFSVRVAGVPQTPCSAGGAFNFGNKGATGGGGGFGAKATGGFGFNPKGQRHPDRSFSFGKKGEAAHATGFGAKTANKAGSAFNFGNASATSTGGGGGFGFNKATAPPKVPDASAMLRQRTPEDKAAFSFGVKATMGGFVFNPPTVRSTTGGKRPFGSTAAASTRTTVDRSSDTFAGKGHSFNFGNKPTSVGCSFSFGASKNKSA
jgi:hypothetical protein